MQADFADGTLTSDAGGLPLREVERRCGQLDALAACLTDPLFAVLADQRPDPAQPLPSATTLCRLENRVSWAAP